MMKVGGIGATKEVDEDLLAILNRLDGELKLKIREKRNNGAAPEKLEPVSFKTQVVAGTNYFVNLKLGDGEFVHVRIYKDLTGNLTVHSVTDIKVENVEIDYF